MRLLRRDEERKSDILMEMKREAAPPMPMVLTVLEMWQQVANL